MAGLSLIVAGSFAVFWASMITLSGHFTKLNFSIYTVVGSVIIVIVLIHAKLALATGVFLGP